MVEPAHTTIKTKGPSYALRKLVRKQDVVEVNRRELGDLKSLDLFQQGLMAGGQFFVSGGVWLALDKAFDRLPGEDLFTPVFSIALGSSIGGLFLIFFAVGSWMMKRKAIEAIFDEAGEDAVEVSP